MSFSAFSEAFLDTAPAVLTPTAASDVFRSGGPDAMLRIIRARSSRWNHDDHERVDRILWQCDYCEKAAQGRKCRNCGAARPYPKDNT